MLINLIKRGLFNIPFDGKSFEKDWNLTLESWTLVNFASKSLGEEWDMFLTDGICIEEFGIF